MWFKNAARVTANLPFFLFRLIHGLSSDHWERSLHNHLRFETTMAKNRGNLMAWWLRGEYGYKKSKNPRR